MAAELTKALGQPVRYNAVTPEQYRGFGFPGAEDLGNMFQFYAEFEDAFMQARPVEVARRLNPGAADLRRLPRAQQGPHSARLTGAPRASRRRASWSPGIAILRLR